MVLRGVGRVEKGLCWSVGVGGWREQRGKSGRGGKGSGSGCCKHEVKMEGAMDREACSQSRAVREESCFGVGRGGWLEGGAVKSGTGKEQMQCALSGGDSCSWGVCESLNTHCPLAQRPLPPSHSHPHL